MAVLRRAVIKSDYMLGHPRIPRYSPFFMVAVTMRRVRTISRKDLRVPIPEESSEAIRRTPPGGVEVKRWSSPHGDMRVNCLR